MNRSIIFFFLSIVILALSFGLPTDSLRKRVLNQIKSFYNNFPVEKVYVHTDKPYYVLGETLWFKAYLVDGMTHQFSAPSNNLYVDLVDPDGKVIKTLTLRNVSGGVAGDFALDGEMKKGIYILRAYTRCMLNFPDHFVFQKEIRVYAQQSKADEQRHTSEVPASQDAFHIHFFPEGGDLISGLSCKVGFKVIGKDGNGIDIQGKVIDEEGQFVAVIKTLKFGLGFFHFTPLAGKTYRAEITYKGKKKDVLLPRIKHTGYTMNYIPGVDHKFEVMLQSNRPEGLKGALLYGHSRGRSFVAESITDDVKNATIQISADSIPEGVGHLTLFNPQGLPECERLIFISRPVHQGHLLATTDRPSYSNRAKVRLNIALQEEKIPIERQGAGLSVSITDQSLVSHQPNGLDIRSYLLLTSELRGRIEQPSYYFDPSNKGAGILLDLLMMTQGWRRFQWDQLLGDNPPTVQFVPEESLTISGQVTKIGEPDKSLQAQVFFNTLDGSFLVGETVTGENGKFAFTGLTFTDTTRVIIKANRYREPKNDKKKRKHDVVGSSGNRYVAIHLDQLQPPPINSQWAIPFDRRPAEAIGRYLRIQQDIAKVDSSYRELTVDLDAVTVKARRLQEEEQLRQTAQLYSRPDQRLVLDSLGPVVYAYQSIFDVIQSRFSGVQVQGEFPNQQAIIRGTSSISGSNNALFVLDGTVISSDAINNIPVQDIAYIDVLKSGAKAAIYGSLGANGVIAVYTKKGSDRSQSPNTEPPVGIIDFKHPGYYQGREFYQPKYDQKLPEHVKPDIRTTLYWNPMVSTDERGSVQLEFYTDDKKSTYQVDVQGISKDGIPLVGRTVFVVE